MMASSLDFARRWLTAASWVYFTGLFGWAALYFLSGDRFGVMALLNTFAPYFFSPLPLALALAAWTKRRELWVGALVGAAIFVWLWGGLFIPKTRPAQAGGPTLKVMTYNALGMQPFTDPAVDVIRAENADIVFLQELNTYLAKAIRNELADEYPYQFLDPVDGVTGMGTISKLPLQPAGDGLPLDWVGTPQLFSLDWNGGRVTLINFHMWPAGLGTPGAIEYNYRTREAQAAALADYARAASTRGPVIAAGDANTTDLSDAYKIVTHTLTDSWREAGFGFGQTFPGSDIPGSSRPRLAGWPVPQWLVRIDYVFHSTHWEAVEAHTAKFDGVSDHRGVVVTLAVK
jgi:endonuclease/exonuclease/phosphatase (EEP) superfamily protein YafD